MYSHIEHDPHPPTVALGHQILQVRLRPKVLVDLANVLLPVAMVTIVCLSGDGRDPDGVCPETLDVVQLPGDAREGAIAVGAEVRTGRAGVLILGKSISEELCAWRREITERYLLDDKERGQCVPGYRVYIRSL